MRELKLSDIISDFRKWDAESAIRLLRWPLMQCYDTSPLESGRGNCSVQPYRDDHSKREAVTADVAELHPLARSSTVARGAEVDAAEKARGWRLQLPEL